MLTVMSIKLADFLEVWLQRIRLFSLIKNTIAIFHIRKVDCMICMWAKKRKKIGEKKKINECDINKNDQEYSQVCFFFLSSSVILQVQLHWH